MDDPVDRYETLPVGHDVIVGLLAPSDSLSTALAAFSHSKGLRPHTSMGTSLLLQRRRSGTEGLQTGPAFNHLHTAGGVDLPPTLGLLDLNPNNSTEVKCPSLVLLLVRLRVAIMPGRTEERKIDRNLTGFSSSSKVIVRPSTAPVGHRLSTSRRTDDELKICQQIKVRRWSHSTQRLNRRWAPRALSFDA